MTLQPSHTLHKRIISVLTIARNVSDVVLVLLNRIEKLKQIWFSCMLQCKSLVAY